MDLSTVVRSADIEESNNRGSEKTPRIPTHSIPTIEAPAMAVSSPTISPSSNDIVIVPTAALHTPNQTSSSKEATSHVSHALDLRLRPEGSARLFRRQDRENLTSTEPRPMYVRCRRLQTVYFELEKRRLKLAEEEERNNHENEMDSLRVESRILDIEENRFNIMAERLLLSTKELVARAIRRRQNSSLPSR